MSTITNREIAQLSVEMVELGWVKSRNGNYYLEMSGQGNLSVVYRDGKGWGWNAYITDELGDGVPHFPRFRGEYSNPVAAMVDCWNYFTTE